MDRRKKIIIVVAVLAVGAGLALEFRKGKSSSPVPSQEERPDGVANASQKPTFDGGIGPSPNEAPMARYSPPVPAGSATDGPPSNSNDPSSNIASSLPPMVDLNAPIQTHTIVDGDTLPKLAQRYLGNGGRSGEIFEFNRDVLSNPDVLPIGAVLRIPPKFMLPSVSSAADQSALPATQPNATGQNVAPPASGAMSSAPPLVPVKPTAAVSTSANQKSTPRTYTVQMGDNLVDIARKVYGDGRRYQDLFEANRRQLRTPADVKPGMVLVTP